MMFMAMVVSASTMLVVMFAMRVFQGIDFLGFPGYKLLCKRAGRIEIRRIGRGKEVFKSGEDVSEEFRFS